MSVYYNEHDPFAAAWLRELIADNLIAAGEVDERSIEDVTPNDLRSFQQCHFFAGIGVWSLAARLAGIPDHAPLWSGSCPCQPFSTAGKGGGFDDERHLWPAFHYLIEQCGPPVITGEQVAGNDGDTWFDLVSADLDATGYAFGVAETCAAGFGAPHKRNRNYWVAVGMADASGRIIEQRAGIGTGPGETKGGWTRHQFTGRGDIGGMADSKRPRLEGLGGNGNGGHQPGRIETVATGSIATRGIADRLGNSPDESWSAFAPVFGWTGTESARRRNIGELDNAIGDGRGERRDNHVQHDRHQLNPSDSQRPLRLERPGPLNGYWRDADWLRCRDESWRPVAPDSFPLADAGSVRNRVGLLRGAGNAVTLGQAEGFLRAVIASVGKWW